MTESASLPWYLGVPLLAFIVIASAAAGRFVRMPGSRLLGPTAITIVLQLTGLSFGLTVPTVPVQVGYMLIGWQAGLAFTRESLTAIARSLPTVVGLIIALNAAAAGLGVIAAQVIRVLLMLFTAPLVARTFFRLSAEPARIGARSAPHSGNSARSRTAVTCAADASL